MNKIVLIPSRLQSERLPEKPLKLIGTRTMIEMVYEAASKSVADKVTIATDSESIFQEVNNFGGDVVMTNPKHANGTERIYEAAEKMGLAGEDIVINLQGDEPFSDPKDINNIFKLLQEENVEMVSMFTDHKDIKKLLQNGTRVAYGARALTKGGYHSRPKMTFPGGILVGCDAGLMVFTKIKGTHTAMKSGMLAAESAFEAISQNRIGEDLIDFEERLKSSWIESDLYKSRNMTALLHKYGTLIGGLIMGIEQFLFRGKLPFTWRHKTPDYACMKKANVCEKINYPKPDGVISFDKLSSVFLSNTNHEEDQPCHLTLKDSSIPISVNLPEYDEPAQRYCPAGVYEVVEKDGENKFQINAQNCVHCKTCDIKDPSQNIVWVTPEGMGGPNYPNM